MVDDRRRRRPDDRDRLTRLYPAAPQHVDPELTPPPMEPARPESISGYDTLPPAMRQQFSLMADGLGTLTEAVGKVWDARNVAPQLERLEQKVDGYVSDAVANSTQLREFVLPAIKGMMAKLDVVTSQHDRNHGRGEQFFDQDWPRMVTTLEKLDQRLDDLCKRLTRLEESVDRLNVTVGGVAARVTAVEAIGNSHDVRITALERRFADQETAAKAEQAVVVRHKGWAKAAWGALVAIGGAVAGYFAGGCS